MLAVHRSPSLPTVVSFAFHTYRFFVTAIYTWYIHNAYKQLVYLLYRLPSIPTVFLLRQYIYIHNVYIQLVEVRLNDAGPAEWGVACARRSEEELRLVYSTVVVRAVNGLTGHEQKASQYHHHYR